MTKTGDLVKEAEVWIADLDWPIICDLIREQAPQYQHLLLRDTKVSAFAEWLKDKAPLCDLVLLGQGTNDIPEDAGVWELSLARSTIEAFRGVPDDGNQAHVVVQAKGYGPNTEVKLGCKDMQAWSEYVELILGIERYWPGAMGDIRQQVDREIEAKWVELDRELTTLLISDELEVDDQLQEEVRSWLNEHAVGIDLETEKYGGVIELRLSGKEGDLWEIACEMARTWPALQPKISTVLEERLQGDLVERLSGEDRIYLREWLRSYSPNPDKAISILDEFDAVGRGPGPKPLSDEEKRKRADTVEKILKVSKEAGITHEQACAREGVPYGTFRDWRRKYLTVE